MYLTKGDFISSKDCRTKLYYIKNNYPANTDNEFMENLAENGRIIGKLSQMVYKEGIMSNYDIQKNIEETKNRIDSGKDYILFEPCVVDSKALAKIDILKISKDELTIIEVKSISLDGESPEIFNKNGTVKATYLDYVEDLAFQYNIVKKNNPEKTITAYLMFLDKGKTLKVHDLFSYFEEVNGQINYNGPEFETPMLNLFAKVDLTNVVEKMRSGIDEAVEKLADLINEDGSVSKFQEKIGKRCSGCSFKSKGELNGFKECWSDLYTENNVFDLYSSTIQKIDGEFVIDKMVNEKNISLLDWPIDKVSEGATSTRQRIQIENTKNGTEHFSQELGKELSGFKYPLHFMDFETSMPALPYHMGNGPYELEAFQFSCHTLYENGDMTHNEWINTSREWPNYNFAKALRDVIGDNGTVFMWHHHERTVLKSTSKQMDSKGIIDDDLTSWIKELTKDENIGRLQDMNRMCKEGYFHPMMKGKTSIKKVLPAVWQNSPYMKGDKHIEEFLGSDIDQNKDLYESLATDDEKVNVGTDAIMAYEEIMKACIKNDHETSKKWADKLLAYCKLDTFAMYIIWKHWMKTYESKYLLEKV